MIDFEMARAGVHGRAVATRGRALALHIERLLREYGKTIYDREMRALRQRKTGFSKRLTRTQLEAELLDVLQRFGLAQMADAGERAAGAFEIQPRLFREVMDAKEIKVRLLVEETEAKTRESLRQIITEALEESPRPSQGDVARRIARQWFGPARKTIGENAEEQERLFSFRRAAAIARTELAGAENVGITMGLQAAGVDLVEWVAQPDDGKSGKRRHYEMNDHPPVKLEAIVAQDRTGWFELPSGIRTPHPQWAGLPAGETINCRCFTRASL